MADQDDAVQDTPPEPAPRRRRRTWPWIMLLSVVLVPMLLLGLWTGIAMSYSYSDGTRAGYIQKFSRKGWLCKTWEGEIAMVNIPGAMQDRFSFTVRNDSIAGEINRLQGRRVSLHYKEHRGVPLSCMGETSYFVDGVQAIDEMGTGMGSGQGGAVAPPGSPGPTGGSAVPRRDTIDPSSGTP